MIKNEKQFKISKKKLVELNNKIRSVAEDSGYDRLKKELISAPLLHLKKELESQIQSYSNIKSKKSILAKQRNFKDLPKLIIEYKIASGMTQKKLSAKIGLKEQQWQRYEAEEFGSISFRKLIDILDRMGLDLTINTTSDPVTGKKSHSITN